MRGVMAIAVQMVLWLFLWTSAVALMATVGRYADPGRRENWIRILGVTTLAVSMLVVLWAIT